MHLAIFGLGYVGFTAACCLASQGRRVTGVDVSARKVAAIEAGDAPIVEPGLADMLAEARGKGLLTARREIGDALADADGAIVCVGTPSGPDGGHDMGHVAAVTRQIAEALAQSERTAPLTIAYRSTFRPGSMETLVRPILEARLGAEMGGKARLAYNPEFLREGSAVHDFFNPPKIVIGTEGARPDPVMEALHEGLEAPVFRVGFREAELTKFVDNAWHAVKVAFANEIGRVCLDLGIEAKTAHKIFVADEKLNISPYYLRPGGAFGGSCLPKDVRALAHIAAEAGVNAPLVDSLLRSNAAHKARLYDYAAEGLAPGASVLVAGLAFKAGTDDLRESPHVDLARRLLAEGYELRIFDPAIDAEKLVGANLGWAYAQLPQLEALLIGAEAAQARLSAGGFDRVVVANGTARALDLPAGQDRRDLDALP
ncbi:MAG: nucleotide sugar dehydrogenase [Pseudomonadota bacterium]